MRLLLAGTLFSIQGLPIGFVLHSMGIRDMATLIQATVITMAAFWFSLGMISSVSTDLDDGEGKCLTGRQ